MAVCECGWVAGPFQSKKSGIREHGQHVSMAADGLCISCGRKFVDPDQASLRARQATVKSKYGITPEDVDLMVMFQGNDCAICGEPLLPNSKTGMHIDHCHVGGYVRGLLCSLCNQGLGMFGDDPLIAIKAAGYLMQPARKAIRGLNVRANGRPSKRRVKRSRSLQEVATAAHNLEDWLRREIEVRETGRTTA